MNNKTIKLSIEHKLTKIKNEKYFEFKKELNETEDMTQLMDLKKRVLEEVNNIELKKLQKILEQIGLTFEQNIQLFRPQDIIKIREHLANNKTKYNCQLMIQLLNMKVINYIEYMNKKNNNDRAEVKQALKQYRKTLIEALPYLQKNKVIEINNTFNQQINGTIYLPIILNLIEEIEINVEIEKEYLNLINKSELEDYFNFILNYEVINKEEYANYVYVSKESILFLRKNNNQKQLVK